MTDCYICYEKETSSKKFVSNPCKCKGTNKIHYSCLNELIKNNGSTCTICKSEFSISESKRKEESIDYRIDSRRHVTRDEENIPNSIYYPSRPVRHEPVITFEDYEYIEAPRIDSVRHPSIPIRNNSVNSNTYYRGRNIEIYATDIGNGQYQINYRPKHDCCIIC